MPGPPGRAHPGPLPWHVRHDASSRASGQLLRWQHRLTSRRTVAGPALVG